MIGEKPFHSIQPREEHSSGDGRVYNQERTSPEQTQRWWSEKNPFTASSQEKSTLQETDVSTIKRGLHQSKHRGDDRRKTLSQHPAKRRALFRRRTCLQSREDFTRANTEVMIGEKPFHNIQPREEHSSGDRRVYNQEKTSPEQIQRWWSEKNPFITSSQEKSTLQETDVSTIKRGLHQSKHRGDDRRKTLSQHPAKRRALFRRQTCLQSREDFTRANTEVMIGEKPFHSIQPREEHSSGDRRVYNQEKISPEQTQRWWSEKNPFTTSSQEKSTLQETDVSTIKRGLHQSKHRDFTSSCKQAWLDFDKNISNKIQSTSGKAFFGRMKLRSTCSRRKGRKKCGEGLEQLIIRSIVCETWSSVTHECMASVALGYCV